MVGDKKELFLTACGDQVTSICVTDEVVEFKIPDQLGSARLEFFGSQLH